MVREREAWRDPCDRREGLGLDVAEQVVDWPDVPIPQLVVVEDVLAAQGRDGGVMTPREGL